MYSSNEKSSGEIQMNLGTDGLATTKSECVKSINSSFSSLEDSKMGKLCAIKKSEGR